MKMSPTRDLSMVRIQSKNMMNCDNNKNDLIRFDCSIDKMDELLRVLKRRINRSDIYTAR